MTKRRTLGQVARHARNAFWYGKTQNMDISCIKAQEANKALNQLWQYVAAAVAREVRRRDSQKSKKTQKSDNEFCCGHCEYDEVDGGLVSRCFTCQQKKRVAIKKRRAK